MSLCVYLCIYKNKKNYFLLLLSIPFRFISEVFSQSKLIKHVYWEKKKNHFGYLIDYKNIVLII